MRIIAGKWRGASLLSPPGRQTRPILDRVKEAVFDILGAKLAMPGELPPRPVLDLFAGTGSLGLEALSRGASFCTFVESDQPTARVLQQNIAKLRAGDQAEVQITNIYELQLTRLPKPAPFELIFVDPPYKDTRRFDPTSPLSKLLGQLADSSAISPEAIILLRHPKKTTCTDDDFKKYTLTDQRTYGDMTISFLACLL